jgi:tol-pal system protein YbgF
LACIERFEQRIAELQRKVAAAVEAKNNSDMNWCPTPECGDASSGQVRLLYEKIGGLTQWLKRIKARSNCPPVIDEVTRPLFGDKEPQPQVEASAAGPARTLFDQATGALDRREYSAAETYLRQLLDQYPADPLAGSAQYWLGEIASVSGEYKTAADRFLKTSTAYPTNERAPEALLKLGISLRRLGNNKDACATFTELAQRYPRASQSVQQRAGAEKKRASCS